MIRFSFCLITKFSIPFFGFSSDDYETDEARRAIGTDYAKAQGLYLSDETGFVGNSYWQLRTPGEASDAACCVDPTGLVGKSELVVDTSSGVRPAICFDGGIVESVNPNGGDESDDYNAVSVADGIEHGSVTADKTRAFAGETVKLTVTPDSGYAVWSVYYYYTESSSFFMNRQVLLPDENGAYTFTMPDEDVTVGAYFIPTAGTQYTIVVGGDVRLQHGAVLVAYGSTGEGSIVFTPEDVPAGGVELKLWTNNPAGGVIHVVLMPDSGYDVAHSNIYDEAKNPLDGEWRDPEHLEGDIFLTDAIAGHLINICPSYKKPRSVTVSDSIVGGTVTASAATAYLYNDVVLTATPDACHTFDSWDVKDADGNPVEVGQGGKFTMPDSDVTVSATFKASHVYGEPVWTWAEDFGTATAAFTCANCGDVQTVDASVTFEKTDATHFAAGKIVYTATAQFGGKTFSDVGEVTIPQIAHTPAAAVKENEVAATYDAQGGYDTVVYCSICGKELSREHTVIEKLTPESPDTPSSPDAPSQSGKCKWCGERHSGFWGSIVGFWHTIVYFWAHLFGLR